MEESTCWRKLETTHGTRRGSSRRRNNVPRPQADYTAPNFAKVAVTEGLSRCLTLRTCVPLIGFGVCMEHDKLWNTAFQIG